MPLVPHPRAVTDSHLLLCTVEPPHNVLILDTMAFERQLYTTGQRGAMQEPSGRPRSPTAPLALSALLQSLGADVLARAPHNAGNAAFCTLLGLQLLLAPDTPLPTPKAPALSPHAHAHAHALATTRRGMSRSPSLPPTIAFMPAMPVFPGPMGMPLAPAPFPGGLVPDFTGNSYSNGNGGGGNRSSSFFPLHRPSSAGNRLSNADTHAHTHNGRMPGRARVSSMNDLTNMTNGNGSSAGVNELGEKMGALDVKAHTVVPQSR